MKRFKIKKKIFFPHKKHKTLRFNFKVTKFFSIFQVGRHIKLHYPKKASQNTRNLNISKKSTKLYLKQTVHIAMILKKALRECMHALNASMPAA